MQTWEGSNSTDQSRNINTVSTHADYMYYVDNTIERRILVIIEID